MGCLRLLLASLVLASHVHLAPVYTGVLAVECFYAISGFYMQMIIREQYAGQPNWRRKFFESRALRIFIPYWIVLLAVVLGIALHHPHSVGEHLPLIAGLIEHPFDWRQWAVALANITIVGTEQIKLWRTAQGCEYAYWQQIIVPQVWSVGIELLFYLTAPWLLLCRTRTLAVITGLSLGAKFLLLAANPAAPFALECGDGLLNGIFPLEIGVFGAGALAYRFYKECLAARQELQGQGPWLQMMLAVGIATAAALYALHIGPRPELRLFAFYGYAAAIALMLPWLFAASRSLHWDRQIGELSYPFYLCHYFFAHEFLGDSPWPPLAVFAMAGIATLICAWLLMRFIEEPLSLFRHRRFRARS